MPLLKKNHYTIEDIYALPEGQRAELIEGQIYDMAPPNTMHQRIVMNLSRKIADYIEAHNRIFLSSVTRISWMKEDAGILDRQSAEAYCHGL